MRKLFFFSVYSALSFRFVDLNCFALIIFFLIAQWRFSMLRSYNLKALFARTRFPIETVS